MEIIEGVALSELCDYSFGDQSGQWGQIYTSFMKDANLFNTEFASKVFDIKKERDYMTLFIDNIRLYKRDIADVKPEDIIITSDADEILDPRVLENLDWFDGYNHYVATGPAY